MSQRTQADFAELVRKYYQRYSGQLKLGPPSFKYDGFTSRATMTSSDGSVEVLCGPPEYHAEVFINTLENQKRWSLADMLGIPVIREWLTRNRPNSEGRSRLEAEIECIFLLLVRLKDISAFGWLGQTPTAGATRPPITPH